MCHKVYRICLLSVVILTVVVGIFYYLNYVQEESTITEGVLVQQESVLTSDKKRNSLIGKNKRETDGIEWKIVKQ